MGKQGAFDGVIRSLKDSTEPANEKYQKWLAGGGKNRIARNAKWLYFIFGCFATIVSLGLIIFIENDGVGQSPLWFNVGGWLTGGATVLLFARGLRLEAEQKQLVRAQMKETYGRGELDDTWVRVLFRRW